MERAVAGGQATVIAIRRQRAAQELTGKEREGLCHPDAQPHDQGRHCGSSPVAILCTRLPPSRITKTGTSPRECYAGPRDRLRQERCSRPRRGSDHGPRRRLPDLVRHSSSRPTRARGCTAAAPRVRVRRVNHQGCAARHQVGRGVVSPGVRLGIPVRRRSKLAAHGSLGRMGDERTETQRPLRSHDAAATRRASSCRASGRLWR